MSRHAARTASTAPPRWASLPPPHDALDVVVVVPVRSEAARLPATLAALAAQVDRDGQPLAADCFEVIVLANNCTDSSAQIVRRFAAQHRQLNVHVVEVTFPPSRANVGHARACLMDEACRRLHTLGRHRGVIASTDGDTRVAPDWLAAILHEVRNGADAVGGRIDLNDVTPLPAGLACLARRDAEYQHLRNRLEHLLDPDPADPWPRHHQHFGASLAVTVTAYLRVGGLPARPYLEDEALWQALVAHDMKLRHSDKVRVVTSSRRRGRVAVGLSWQLREWSALASCDADAEVGNPTRLARDLVRRRRLRVWWAANRPSADAGDAPPPGVTAMAADLHVPVGWLTARVKTSETFGQLWAAVSARRARQADAAADARIPMQEAIVLLRAMLAPGDRSSAHRGDAHPRSAAFGASDGDVETADEVQPAVVQVQPVTTALTPMRAATMR